MAEERKKVCPVCGRSEFKTVQVVFTDAVIDENDDCLYTALPELEGQSLPTWKNLDPEKHDVCAACGYDPDEPTHSVPVVFVPLDFYKLIHCVTETPWQQRPDDNASISHVFEDGTRLEITWLANDEGLSEPRCTLTTNTGAIRVRTPSDPHLPILSDYWISDSNMNRYTVRLMSERALTREDLIKALADQKIELHMLCQPDTAFIQVESLSGAIIIDTMNANDYESVDAYKCRIGLERIAQRLYDHLETYRTSQNPQFRDIYALIAEDITE